MIKLSCFLPWQHTHELQPYLDYAFLEPMSQPSYIEFYKDLNRVLSRDKIPMFFDNGLIELGRSLSCEDLSSYINSILTPATAITNLRIASPDRLGDWNFNFYHAYEMSWCFPKCFIWVTLAGPTPLRFWWQAHLVKLAGFGGICLPYRRNRFGLNIRNLPTHLFGYRSSEHYPSYKGPTWLDTTEPINCAIMGWDYETNGIASFPRSPLYFNGLLTQFQLTTAIRNIDYLRRRMNQL